MGTFKIDFLVIGTQKGGTTALDYYLRRHPGIEMGRKKELHFFDNEKIFANATVDYSILEKQFSISPGKIYGDVTPIYMYWEPAIRRIWQYNSRFLIIKYCKLLILFLHFIFLLIIYNNFSKFIIF